VDNKLFIGKNVIIQGITGGQGSFHAKAMKQAGTSVIAGTSPNKAGQTVDDIPVYGSIKDIAAEHTIDVSVIFVPAPFAKAAILEAITADIPLIICITEGVPIHDMLQIKQRLVGQRSTLIGPNCPGVLLPGVNKLGIIPSSMGLAGSVGIVSRSGTLTYEAMAGLTARGIGQKYVIGIGGDPIRGTGFIECLELFENDPEVTSIVMIGEIGGTDEIAAADYIKKHITKPIYGYIAGHHAPAGVQLGHAGAILGSENESAAAKTAQLSRVGVTVSESIVQLTNSVK
jgi:succinyl-CoA synthetase alpha subunit